MDSVTFDQVIDLIQLLIVVIAMILLHRSVPVAQLEKLFAKLEANARRTETPVDDAMVTFGRLLSTLLTGQIPGQQPATAEGPAAQPQPQPVPVVVTGSITASPAPAVPLDTAAPVVAGTDLYSQKTQLHDSDVPG